VIQTDAFSIQPIAAPALLQWQSIKKSQKLLHAHLLYILFLCYRPKFWRLRRILLSSDWDSIEENLSFNAAFRGQ
jgi:hypothetical protein